MKRIYFILIGIVATITVARGQGSPNDLPADISNVSQTVSPDITQNYVLSYTYLKDTTSHPTNLLTGDANPEIKYFDGLGRPVESVSVKATTLGKDLIYYQNYDEYGRADTLYLPYAKSSNNGAYIDESSFIIQQNTFLTSIYGSPDGSIGYAVTGYENSPLNRVLQQGAPGASWQLTANPVEYAYKTNTSTVQSWTYSGDTYTAFSYAIGTLYLKETTDEDNKVVKEYTDKEGKLVQRETGSSITRYCYDDFKLLRCVVQPRGSSPASTDYCFYYKYDARKRLTDKYIPGGSWIYYLYDARDRQVLSQDGNQRSTNEWTYSIFDGFNRPVKTGIWATTTTRASLDSTMSSVSNLNYIDNLTYGKTQLKLYHYSDYSSLPTANAMYTTDATVLGVSAATSNNDRLTWTETRALNYETGMDYLITSAFYYDKYGRLIQTVADNHLGGMDYITNKYNFTGQIVQTRYRHVADGATTYTDQYSDYDHRGRLMKTRYKINGGTELMLSANNYDEAGHLVDKYLHSENGGNFLQRLDYEYNIRGWLTKINDPVTFTENDKLGIQLYYDTAPTGGSALCNGNISGMQWGTPTSPLTSGLLYRFSYDNMNRLTGADFDKTGYATNAFDCTFGYNANGNFNYINRRKSDGSYIDQLSFGYVGNQIDYIDDSSLDIANVVDYPGALYGTYSFEYDYNGNMSYEPYKEISLAYNLISLPYEADFGSNRKINYFYTFDGTKLRQTVEDNGILTKTDYCGPFVYETVSGVRSLKYFVTPEGRAVKNGSTWEYEYNLKDHLGNTRVVIKNNSGVAQVIQERHYYPFGMEMSELSSGTSTNKFLYNSKEHQNDFELDWYDYGARFYDPELGRWHSPDPLSEAFNSQSPYCYGKNNALRFIDPTGMVDQDIFGRDKFDKNGTFIPWQDRKSKGDENGNIESSLQNSFSITKMIKDFFGWGLDPDNLEDREKMQKSAEHLEQALVAIETANGVLMILVPGSSVAELMADVESGKGSAALATIPFVVLDAASFGAGSGAKSGYKTFSGFKMAFGAAGEGMAWHHIVEQTPSNIFNFGSESIHNIDNIIKLPHGKGSIHAKISAFYSSKQNFTNGMTVRQWLNSQSFEEQFKFGTETLKRYMK